MLPVIVLVGCLMLSAILGQKEWRSKSVKITVISAVAMLQTLLYLVLLFTMKMPKGNYLP